MKKLLRVAEVLLEMSGVLMLAAMLDLIWLLLLLLLGDRVLMSQARRARWRVVAEALVVGILT